MTVLSLAILVLIFHCSFMNVKHPFPAPPLNMRNPRANDFVLTQEAYSKERYEFPADFKESQYEEKTSEEVSWPSEPSKRHRRGGRQLSKKRRADEQTTIQGTIGMISSPQSRHGSNLSSSRKIGNDPHTQPLSKQATEPKGNASPGTRPVRRLNEHEEAKVLNANPIPEVIAFRKNQRRQKVSKKNDKEVSMHDHSFANIMKGGNNVLLWILSSPKDTYCVIAMDAQSAVAFHVKQDDCFPATINTAKKLIIQSLTPYKQIIERCIQKASFHTDERFEGRQILSHKAFRKHSQEVYTLLCLRVKQRALKKVFGFEFLISVPKGNTYVHKEALNKLCAML